MRFAGVTLHCVYAVTLRDRIPQSRRVGLTQLLHFTHFEPYTAAARAVIEYEWRPRCRPGSARRITRNRHLLHLRAEAHGTRMPDFERCAGSIH
jgi:hypothetical protein